MVQIPVLTYKPESLIVFEKRAFLLGQKAATFNCGVHENPYLFIHTRLAHKWQQGYTLNSLVKAVQSWK